MKKKRKKIKAIRNLTVISVALLAFSIIFSIVLGTEDAQVKEDRYMQDNVWNTRYYYSDTFLCKNTYTFDSITFTHNNYGIILWKKYNSTHYQLNGTMESSERTPKGYMLFGADNRFGAEVTVIIKGSSYKSQVNDFYTLDTFNIMYFQLQQFEKLTINVNFKGNNTHNSDSGDKFSSGEEIYDMTIFDPTHNDMLQSIFMIMLISSIFTSIGLTISLLVLRYKGKQKKQRSQYRVIR